MLRQYGAGGPVHVISAHLSCDGKTYLFEEATHHIEGVAWAPSTVCIYNPRTLAVFSDEYDRFVLRNSAA
jgi:hypothetical protein